MSEWDDYASQWDQNEDARRYSQLAFDSLKEKLAPTPLTNMRILDFGAGTGLLTEKLAPFADSVIAIDSSAKMIEVL